ncbi:hypothetical protein F53441_9694 [Fusarium austroafricanum]|uniref:Uncharacterized protein n=1 Tax=Fusarium austroafricanum TaxID=2364996 RepID=A0A8H4KC89_9HYPO|nr:hypothetical protein F53441_9694 [Fusarium austroafricanum]
MAASSDHRGSPGSSLDYFIAGTMIETSMGPKAIEKVHDGDVIFAHASEGQQWSRSGEAVENASPPQIYGFNGERPFFTAGHPFHTVTGLRAVDPELAGRANPSLDIGPLKVGNLLLRLNSAKTGYDYEPIESFSSTGGGDSRVYGVHLRDAPRSYHANGYLVTLNTSKRSDERKDPGHDRSGNSDKTYKMIRAGINTEDVVTLKSGVVSINGVQVSRVMVNDSLLTWSLQSPNNKMWEHGRCNFRRGGEYGVGIIVRTSSDGEIEDIEDDNQQVTNIILREVAEEDVSN